MPSKTQKALLASIPLLALLGSHAARAEDCGPAMLDAAFNINMSCAIVPEGAQVPEGRYSLNWRFAPETFPGGVSYPKWELSGYGASTCAASANCATLQADQLLVPQVNYGATSFYSVVFGLDENYHAWYTSSSSVDARLSAAFMPPVDRALALPLSVKCGEPPTPVNDFDGDKLDDAYEACIGTNKYSTDSDGDGYNDLDETVSGTVTLMNPSVADVPLLRLQSNGDTKIVLDTSLSSGDETTTSVTKGITTSTGLSQTDTQSHEVSVSVTAGIEGGILPTFLVTAGYSYTTERSKTVSQENTVSYETAVAATKRNDVTVNGGSVSVSVTIFNTSPISVTLSNLTLNARFPNGEIIGDLTPTTEGSGVGREIALGGNSQATITLRANLDTNTTLKLMRDPYQVRYAFAAMPTIMANGMNYSNTTATNVNARTAPVKVDFDDNGTTIYSLRPALPGTGLTLAKLLPLLGLYHTVDSTGKLTGICKIRHSYNTANPPALNCPAGQMVSNDTTKNAKWVIVYNGAFYEGTALSASPLIYPGSSEVSFIYIVDQDGDKVSKREETFYGSDDTKANSDSDTLNDYQELYGWTAIPASLGFPYNSTPPPRITSDPTKADSDFDGLTDDQEKTKGTDPRNPDTDGDGTKDGADASPLSNPSSVDTDGDTLTDAEEAKYGTDPTKVDTDGDWVRDQDEVRCNPKPYYVITAPWNGCTNPKSGDTDGDGLGDFNEVWYGIDPNVKDTDGDGIGDNQEFSTNKAAPLKLTYVADIQTRAGGTCYTHTDNSTPGSVSLSQYKPLACWDANDWSTGTNGSSGNGMMSMYVLYKEANFYDTVQAVTDVSLRKIITPCPGSTATETFVGCWGVEGHFQGTSDASRYSNGSAGLYLTRGNTLLAQKGYVDKIAFAVPAGSESNCILTAGYNLLGCFKADDDGSRSYIYGNTTTGNWYMAMLINKR